MWPCWQLGMPGWCWMAGERLEESHSTGDRLWSSRKAGMTTRIHPGGWHRPGCLHQGLNQLQGAGIRGWAGLGEAGKRGWDLSWVSLCRRGSESPHPAWETFGSPHSSQAGPGMGPAGIPCGNPMFIPQGKSVGLGATKPPCAGWSWEGVRLHILHFPV